MKRWFAWGLVLIVVSVSADAPVVGRAAERAAGRTAPRARKPFAKAITDKDVEPFGLLVHWKALCVLGEHGKPTGIYATDREIFTTDDQTRVSCYDPNDGKQRWMRVLDRPYQPVFEPAVDGKDAFVVGAGYLISMDRRFGNERWRVKLKNIPSGGAAVVGDFVYVAGSDGWLRAYSRSERKESWYFNARAPLIGSPVPVGTEAVPLVFVAAGNNKIYCLSHRERRIIWEQETLDRVVASPARVGPYLYVPCTDYSVYAIDANARPTKRLQWVFHSGSQVMRSPVVIGATVYFASLRNGFYALRRVDGKRRWWRETGVRLLSTGKRRCYVLDSENAILVLDKLTGKLEGRLVLPKDYRLMTTNVHNDAIYLLSRDGLIVCLREREAVQAAKAKQPAPTP